MNPAAGLFPALPDEIPTLPQDAIEVGRVLGAWGIKGGIKVRPFAADPQALFSSKRWFVQPPEGIASAAVRAETTWPLLLRVVSAREHGDGVVATVHEAADRSQAEALRGARLFVSRASFPKPDDNEFYWVDLIGLAVTGREDAALGTVVGLLETGPHCVLRVQPSQADSEEMLIPFVDAYVQAVDLPARRITVDWEAGY